MKTKIVFFGSSKHVIPVIQTLKSTKSGFNLVLVVTTEKNPSDPIPHFCNKNKIMYISVASVTSLNNSIINGQLSMVNCQLAALAYFGLIIPQKVLKFFSKGIINIHPSLLPKYRGPTPVQSAILNGEKTTGVSIIRLDNKIDHGPILAQKEEKILKDDTADTLYARLFKSGSDLVAQTIKHNIKEQLKPHQQDHSKATFTKLLKKNDGQINIDNPPSSIKIDKMIRAYHPWPGTWTRSMINGKSSIIKFLPEKKLQVEGKNPMSYKDFINGYPKGRDLLRKINLTPN